MRLFVAVTPPALARHAAFETSRGLAATGARVAWVREANLHLTLRFLGEQPAEALGGIESAMRATAAVSPAFRAGFSECGAFPDARRARVLWLGVGEGVAAFRALAGALERELVARGFEPAVSPFTAHLTLGRVRAPSDWSSALRAAQPPAGTFPVDRLELMASVLAPGGSHYDVVATARLGVTEAP